MAKYRAARIVVPEEKFVQMIRQCLGLGLSIEFKSCSEGMRIKVAKGGVSAYEVFPLDSSVPVIRQAIEHLIFMHFPESLPEAKIRKGGKRLRYFP